MPGFAVAVHTRPSGVLLAAADEGGIRLLAAAPAGTPSADAVTDFFGDDPPAVVVRVGTTPGGPFPGTPRVLLVPVAVAVLAVGPVPAAGPVLVVHAGPDGTDAVVVDGGTVVPSGTAPRGVPVEIVLAGERVLDDPGWPAATARTAACPVRVAGPAGPGDPADVPGAGPDTAAVLGAGSWWRDIGARETGARETGARDIRPQASGRGTAVRRGRGAGRGARAGRGPRPGPRPARPPGARRARDGARRRGPARRGPRPGGGGGARQAGGRGSGPRPVRLRGGAARRVGAHRRGPGPPARAAHPGRTAGRPDGADLVVVERSPLGYDAGREPDRVRRELAGLLGGRAGAGPPGPRTVGGRAVLGWTQHPGDGTVVDWHAVFEGGEQLVVGCRRPAGAVVTPACAEVVGSVRAVR